MKIRFKRDDSNYYQELKYYQKLKLLQRMWGGDEENPLLWGKPRLKGEAIVFGESYEPNRYFISFASSRFVTESGHFFSRFSNEGWEYDTVYYYFYFFKAWWMMVFEGTGR